MKIRTRLAVWFTIIVASLLFVFAISIYFFSSSYRKQQFYERLNEKANNYAQLLIASDEPNVDLVKFFDKNTAYLPDERILVYDSNNKLLFNTKEDSTKVGVDFLNKVRSQKKISYTEGKIEVLATLCEQNNKSFVVLVSAYNADGFNNLNNLRLILIVGFFVCVVVTMLIGWLYAGRALSPISGVIKQVENISPAKLTDRVSEGDGIDEIGQLTVTFNKMLDRIQRSFELQKSFVSNSSHELRTPLTAITGQLEVALMSKRNPEEYKSVLSSVLEDIKSVNRLTNGLLELAQADMDISKVKMKPVRLDELLWQTRNDLLKRNPSYTINIEINDFPEDESKLTILGNDYLLRSALINIMDNACKFSKSSEVTVIFRSENNSLNISFLDKGIGISETDIKLISQPFYRGVNAKNYPGHGLGLSLTFKIIALHAGEIKIDSTINEYTRVNVRLQSI